jgi:GH24 family phage-related lysozyme (muramidase)
LPDLTRSFLAGGIEPPANLSSGGPNDPRIEQLISALNQFLDAQRLERSDTIKAVANQGSEDAHRQYLALDTSIKELTNTIKTLKAGQVASDRINELIDKLPEKLRNAFQQQQQPTSSASPANVSSKLREASPTSVPETGATKLVRPWGDIQPVDLRNITENIRKDVVNTVDTIFQKNLKELAIQPDKKSQRLFEQQSELYKSIKGVLTDSSKSIEDLPKSARMIFGNTAKTIESRVGEIVEKAKKDIASDKDPKVDDIGRKLNREISDDLRLIIKAINVQTKDLNRSQQDFFRTTQNPAFRYAGGLGNELTSGTGLVGRATPAIASAAIGGEAGLIVKVLQESHQDIKNIYYGIRAIPSAIATVGEGLTSGFGSIRKFLDPHSVEHQTFAKSLGGHIGASVGGSAIGGGLAGGLAGVLGNVLKGSLGIAAVGGLGAFIGKELLKTWSDDPLIKKFLGLSGDDKNSPTTGQRIGAGATSALGKLFGVDPEEMAKSVRATQDFVRSVDEFTKIDLDALKKGIQSSSETIADFADVGKRFVGEVGSLIKETVGPLKQGFGEIIEATTETAKVIAKAYEGIKVKVGDQTLDAKQPIDPKGRSAAGALFDRLKPSSDKPDRKPTEKPTGGLASDPYEALAEQAAPTLGEVAKKALDTQATAEGIPNTQANQKPTEFDQPPIESFAGDRRLIPKILPEIPPQVVIPKSNNENLPPKLKFDTTPKFDFQSFESPSNLKSLVQNASFVPVKSPVTEALDVAKAQQLKRDETPTSDSSKKTESSIQKLGKFISGGFGFEQLIESIDPKLKEFLGKTPELLSGMFKEMMPLGSKIDNGQINNIGPSRISSQSLEGEEGGIKSLIQNASYSHDEEGGSRTGTATKFEQMLSYERRQTEILEFFLKEYIASKGGRASTGSLISNASYSEGGSLGTGTALGGSSGFLGGSGSGDSSGQTVPSAPSGPSVQDPGTSQQRQQRADQDSDSTTSSQKSSEPKFGLSPSELPDSKVPFDQFSGMKAGSQGVTASQGTPSPSKSFDDVMLGQLPEDQREGAKALLNQIPQEDKDALASGKMSIPQALDKLQEQGGILGGTYRKAAEGLINQAGGQEGLEAALQANRGSGGATVSSGQGGDVLGNTGAKTIGDLGTPKGQVESGGSSVDLAAGMLKKHEGFRATPYWDVNAYRVGYGSDTITKADGSIVKVTPGMKVSKEDADRDLTRRVGEFQSKARNQVGAASWDKLNPKTQAALTSVAYNYGRIPGNVASAIKTGDREQIASSVEGLQGHNAGINRNRRLSEARDIRSSSDQDSTVQSNQGGDRIPSSRPTGGIGNPEEMGASPRFQNRKVESEAKDLTDETSQAASRLHSLQPGGVTITSTTGGGHAEHSQHYSGRAVDVRIKDLNMEQRQELLENAKKAGFTRVGIAKDHLHLDMGGKAGQTHVFDEGGGSKAFGMNKAEVQSRLDKIPYGGEKSSDSAVAAKTQELHQDRSVQSDQQETPTTSKVFDQGGQKQGEPVQAQQEPQDPPDQSKNTQQTPQSEPEVQNISANQPDAAGSETQNPEFAPDKPLSMDQIKDISNRSDAIRIDSDNPPSRQTGSEITSSQDERTQDGPPRRFRDVLSGMRQSENVEIRDSPWEKFKGDAFVRGEAKISDWASSAYGGLAKVMPEGNTKKGLEDLSSSWGKEASRIRNYADNPQLAANNFTEPTKEEAQKTLNKAQGLALEFPTDQATKDIGKSLDPVESKQPDAIRSAPTNIQNISGSNDSPSATANQGSDNLMAQPLSMESGGGSSGGSALEDQPLKDISTPDNTASGLEAENASLSGVEKQIEADADRTQELASSANEGSNQSSGPDRMGDAQFKSFTYGDVALTVHSGEGL